MAMNYRLRVDPIACDGRGICADLLPERITLDDWGYPIIDPTPMGPHLMDHARRAVAACPKLALLLEQVPDEAPTPARSGQGAGRRA